MANITTAPGLLNIDPIQGLVDYVLEVKPYHSKIFQVLFEYVYADAVKTTVTDTLVWSFDDNQTYIVSQTDPALLGPVSAGAFWFDPISGTLYIRNAANTAWIVYQTGLLDNPNPGVSVDTSITEFMETIAFDWTGNFSYAIIAANSSANSITLAGNLVNALKPEDLTEITGSTGNDGAHTIVSAAFDPMSDTTVVILDSVPSSVGDGTFTVQDVDITYWYQFSVVGVNPVATLPSRSPSVQNIQFPQTLTDYPPLGPILNSFAPPTPVVEGTGYTVGDILTTTSLSFAAPVTIEVDSVNLLTGAVLSAHTLNTQDSIDNTITITTDVTGGSGTGVVFVFDKASPQNLTNYAVQISTVKRGAGYASGTYLNVPLLGGTGTGATVQIVVDGGSITSAEIVLPGTGYLPNDIVTVNNALIGGGSGFEAYYGYALNPQQLSISTLVPSITVAGNATTSVQVGAEFQVQGSGANDGLYHAIYVQYEPISNTTTIGVSTTTGVTMLPASANPGGMLVPYRFINEVFAGTYDNAGFDSQPFDQSAGSLIHQGP